MQRNITDTPVSIWEEFRLRIIWTFYPASDDTWFLIFHYAWAILWFVPNMIEFIVQFFVIRIIYAAGKSGEFITTQLALNLLWLVPGSLLGVLYVLISYFFLAIEAVLTLPNTILAAKSK